MKRREFIAALGGAAAWPVAARAQQSSRMKRIAMVSPATKIGDMGVNGNRFYRMIFEELSRLGYDEGRSFGQTPGASLGGNLKTVQCAFPCIATRLGRICRRCGARGKPAVRHFVGRRTDE